MINALLLDGARKLSLSSFFFGIDPLLKVAALRILPDNGYKTKAWGILLIYALCSRGIALPGLIVESRAIRSEAK